MAARRKPASKAKRVVRRHATILRKPEKARTGIDRNFEDFVEELAEHHRRLHQHHCAARDWWYGTFGAAGPLLGAAVGMIGVAIIAWALSIVNAVLNVAFVSLLSVFLFSNLPTFLLIFLVVNYLKHVYISNSRLHYIIKPIKVAFEIGVAFWLLAWVMQFAGMQSGNVQLTAASLSIMGSLGQIFFGFMVLGYIVALVKREKDLYGRK